MEGDIMEELFRGSYMNGLGIDLVKWAGLTLSDQQHDKLWGDINETDLLELCSNVTIDVDEYDEENDNIPTMSDTYYTVYADDVEALKLELKQVIEQRVS
jgi:hypothetical protein